MNRYAQLTEEQLTEHFANYLISSWSYSAVMAFARNEKAFEMQYVYGERDKSSISSIAGNAYHSALRAYFEKMRALSDSLSRGEATPDMVEITQAAYDYLDAVTPSSWRLSEKVATVEAAIVEATGRVNKLVGNFASEVGIYTDSIDEVLGVEKRIEQWVTVNGVDIPLPMHAVIDLAVRTRDGKTVIVDHKSKDRYTSEDEVALVHGQQAITYVKAWETLYPSFPVDEVWFIENKAAANKDGSPQLVKHVIVMDGDSRRLYEALLYEPLRRMIEAVSDPDYIYTINKDDNFVDKAALYDFWARTQISEIEDFPDVPEDKKELVAKRQRKIKDSSLRNVNPRIITEFRKAAARFISFDYAHSDMTQEQKIEHILRTHHVIVQVADKIEGYSCDTFLCDLAAGTPAVSIYTHNMDIAYALDVPKVRVDSTLVMHNGKSYVGIEVNKKRTETLLWDKSCVEGHRIPLGKDNFRNTVVWDLDSHATPHMLVCGSTGSGKSVELISIMHGAIAAGVEQIIIFDPKWEFAMMAPEGVEVVSEIPEIEERMRSLVDEMNDRIRRRQKKLTLVIFDEFADAVDQARSGKALDVRDEDGQVVYRMKSLSENFKMLLQKGRSCGFRFVAATQRADTKTINGTIKVNFPVLMCFRVPKGLDSKVVIDTEGAESLAGNGDGLLRSPEYQDRLVRFQGFFYQQ